MGWWGGGVAVASVVSLAQSLCSCILSLPSSRVTCVPRITPTNVTPLALHRPPLPLSHPAHPFHPPRSAWAAPSAAGPSWHSPWSSSRAPASAQPTAKAGGWCRGQSLPLATLSGLWCWRGGTRGTSTRCGRGRGRRWGDGGVGGWGCAGWMGMASKCGCAERRLNACCPMCTWYPLHPS